MARACTASALLAVTLAGCGASGASDSPGDAERSRRSTERGGSPPAPADAGTRTGHGVDADSVVVPDWDASPPQAVIALGERGGRTLAAARSRGRSQPRPVRLHRPALRATTVGRDPQGGVARVRVSIRERIACRASGGVNFQQERRRYFPPPQVGRIQARSPGTRLPATRRRSLPLALSVTRCGHRATLVRVRGELWAEAINGLGLEAVTAQLQFEYRPSAVFRGSPKAPQKRE